MTPNGGDGETLKMPKINDSYLAKSRKYDHLRNKLMKIPNNSTYDLKKQEDIL